jgi:EmrB/QacA subfamily drug resistance transporter
MSEMSVPATAGLAGVTREPDSRRWLILGVIGIAQLMVVLDITIMNIALPSAQHALGFSNADRQWVVTAYALSFGSLLLFCGRLADLIGRKGVFITGLAGFAVASAVGGASTSFAMLVTARACQGAFGALLAPAALSLLTTTFSDPEERGRAFGVYGAIAGGGGAVGLLLGGVLTEYLSWRWCLYVNLIFAIVAVAGSLLWLRRQPRQRGIALDIPGVLLASGGLFCLVYGFSNVATHSWGTPSTYGFLVAAAVLLSGFAVWQGRAKHPLLPPHVVLDRNRGASYLGILIVGIGIFGVFLFLTYYMQGILGYSAVISGVAFLPMVACIVAAANVSNVTLLPRIGPRPLIVAGMLFLAGGMAWLTRIGVRGDYVGGILGPLMLTGLGMGLMFSTGLNAGTYGVAPQDSGVASASVNTGQQVGGSIGTSFLNSIAVSAATAYLAANAHTFHGTPRALQQAATVHSYTTVFWWCAGIFALGAIACGPLMRRGPLYTKQGTPDHPGAAPSPDGQVPSARQVTAAEAIRADVTVPAPDANARRDQ